MSHANEAAHDVADHVVQESARLELEAPVGAMPRNFNAGHGLDGSERLATTGAKRSEVMFTEEVHCRPPHGLAVQWPEDPARPAGLDSGANG